jgi:serine/threonine protein kinase
MGETQQQQQQQQQQTIATSTCRTWKNMTRTIAHYERKEQIGEGTYGQVYKAICKETKQTVAMKKMRLHHSGYWGMPLQLVREIKILRKLQHPNLLEMIEVVTSKGVEHLDPDDPPSKKAVAIAAAAASNSTKNDNNNNNQDDAAEYAAAVAATASNDKTADARESYKGNLFLVLEYVQHDLTGLLDISYPFTVVQIKCIFRQLLQALHYMHKNKYVHRDIKSSNILLTSSFQLKLADFGLARSLDVPFLEQLENINNNSGTIDDSRLDLTNKVITLWYRPPEILLGTVHYGCAVDIWSAGCILAELNLGKPLFTGKTEVEQLRLIADLLGTPSPDTFRYIQSLKKRQYSNGGSSTANIIVNNASDRGSGGGGGGINATNPSSSSNSAMIKAISDMETTCTNLRPSKLREKYTNKQLNTSPGSSGPTTNSSSSSSTMPDTAITLLEKLFDWDPRKRLTAENALEHRYFWTQPVAPTNPSDLGTLQVSASGDYHEFKTKQKRRQAKAVAEEAKQDALFNGASHEEAMLKFDSVYRNLMQQVAQEGFSFNVTSSSVTSSNSKAQQTIPHDGSVTKTSTKLSSSKGTSSNFTKTDSKAGSNKENSTTTTTTTKVSSSNPRENATKSGTTNRQSPSHNSPRREGDKKGGVGTGNSSNHRNDDHERATDIDKSRSTKDDRHQNRSSSTKKKDSRSKDITSGVSSKRHDDDDSRSPSKRRSSEVKEKKVRMDDDGGSATGVASEKDEDASLTNGSEKSKRRSSSRRRRGEKTSERGDGKDTKESGKDRRIGKESKRRRKDRTDSEERSYNGTSINHNTGKNSSDDEEKDGSDRRSKKSRRRDGSSKRHRSKEKDRDGDHHSSGSNRRSSGRGDSKERSRPRSRSRERDPTDWDRDSSYRRGGGSVTGNGEYDRPSGSNYDRAMMPPPPYNYNNRYDDPGQHYHRRDEGRRGGDMPPPFGRPGPHGHGPPFGGPVPPGYRDGPPEGPHRWHPRDGIGNEGLGPPSGKNDNRGPRREGSGSIPPPGGDHYGPPPPRWDGPPTGFNHYGPVPQDRDWQPRSGNGPRRDGPPDGVDIGRDRDGSSWGNDHNGPPRRVRDGPSDAVDYYGNGSSSHGSGPSMDDIRRDRPRGESNRDRGKKHSSRRNKERDGR